MEAKKRESIGTVGGRNKRRKTKKMNFLWFSCSYETVQIVSTHNDVHKIRFLVAELIT
jgi:hypothetical protein